MSRAGFPHAAMPETSKYVPADKFYPAMVEGVSRIVAELSCQAASNQREIAFSGVQTGSHHHAGRA